MFDAIKLLQAYMPDPDTDIEWFKRVLKDVKVAQVTEEKEWYPFGCPPMVRRREKKFFNEVDRSP
jgi:hypothetical protein